MIFRRPKRTVCPCGLTGEVVLNPPRDAAMALARAVKPAARHYHHAAYWRHLYDDNPFRVDPWGVAYMVDGVAEAMVTAVGVPTTKGPGALLAAWMRLPECHSALAGGLVLQPYLGRQDLQLLAYDPSPEGRAFYERTGWARFDAREWRGHPRLASLGPRDESNRRPWPWTVQRAEYEYAIERSRDFWAWRSRAPGRRIEEYGPGVVVAWTRGAGVARIEDVVFESYAATGCLAGLIRQVAEGVIDSEELLTSEVQLESNHSCVVGAAQALGLKPGRLVPLYWRGADPKGTCYRSLADADFGVRVWW